jgi:ribosomal-protein-alanine N-acetyltransferase
VHGNLTMRPMRPEDATAIAALDAACIGSAHWPAAAYTIEDASLLRGWLAQPSGRATQDIAIAGFIAVRCVADEMEILNLAVAPESRRQGVATQLFEEALQYARLHGVRRVYLEVRETDASALAFYAARGLEPTGRRTRYYTNPIEDALVLMRVLAGPAPG